MSIRSIINFKDAADLSIGVNVKLLPEGRQEIGYCILKKNGDVVSVVERREGINNVDELLGDIKAHVEKGVRVHVNCVGRSVLTRVVQGDQPDISRQWSNWFPGIAKENFIVQSFVKKEFAALSLFRIEDIQKSNLFLDNSITSFSLGVCVAEAIASIADQKSMVLEGYRIDFDEGQIKSFVLSDVASPDEYLVGSDSIPASGILAYASAFSFFLPVQGMTLEGLPVQVQEGDLRYRVNQRLHHVGKYVIVTLLCLLAVNLFLYFWLDGTVTEMESTLLFRQGSRKTLEQSAMSTQRLSTVYEALGYKTNRVPLYYADQLAKTMPPEIQLNVLQAGLLDERTFRSERRLQFDALQIKVQGMSRDPAILNNWITALGGVEWVTGITEQKYQFDPRLGRGVFEFLILVKPR